MTELRTNYRAWIFPVGIMVTSSFLFATSLYSLLLFHTLVKLFTVIISFGIFVIAWSSRRYVDNIFFLFIGIGYFFIGSLDLAHTLTYDGMNIIKGYDNDFSNQLWIASRYLEAISFLVAFIFFQNKNIKKLLLVRRKSQHFFLICCAIFIAIVVVAYLFDVPAETHLGELNLGMGRIYNEYAISLIFMGAIVLFFKKRKSFERDVTNLLSLSLIIKIVAEIVFAKYDGLYEFPNIAGHILFFISFLLLYRSVIEGGLMRPYRFLFLDLKKSEERYRSLVEFSPDAIVVHGEGKILYANGPAKKLFGIEKDDKIVGAELIDFFGPEYHEQIHFRIKNIFSGKWRQSPTMEMAVLHANGQTIPVEVKGMKIVYEGREVIESIIRDVSERKAAEQELIKTQTELRKKIEEQLMESYNHLGLVNRKISLLLELESHSQSNENKQEIIEYILSSLRSLSHAKSVMLYLAVGKNHFNLTSSTGLEKENLTNLQVVNENSAVFINQLVQSGRRSNGACELVDTGYFKENLNFKYFVALPIMSGSICKGFLFLGFIDRKSMEAQELEFLDVFAKHVSSVLTNSNILN